MGLEVVGEATTGREAVELTRALLPDVVIMDIHLPELTGIEATRRIRRLAGPAADIPIIALTADIDPDLESMAKLAGVSQLAAKPIDPPRLREIALSWTRRAKQAAE